MLYYLILTLSCLFFNPSIIPTKLTLPVSFFLSVPIADSAILSQSHSLIKLSWPQLQPPPCLNLTLLPLSWSRLLKVLFPLSLTPRSLFQPQISQKFMKLWVKETQDQIPTSRLFPSCVTVNKIFSSVSYLETVFDWVSLGRLRVQWTCPWLPALMYIRCAVLRDQEHSGCFTSVLITICLRYW